VAGLIAWNAGFVHEVLEKGAGRSHDSGIGDVYMNSLAKRASQCGGARTTGAPSTVAIQITVVTATLNGLEELKPTIRNVQEQVGCIVEHIVIDGGSTDGTVDYLRQLGNSIEFWQSESDTGIADAMNKGIAFARGDYVLVLHAGDHFIDPGALARALPFLTRRDDIVAFDIILVGQSRQARRLSSSRFSWRTRFKTPIKHQGAFCRRDLFHRIGLFDTSLRIAMDYEFFLRASLRNTSLRVVPEAISEMASTGVSSRTDWSSLRERFGEEKKIHLMHCPNLAMRGIYELYWPLYLTYRWLRNRFQR
jgi:glycosyltransferase involved in cell wall biosynthesis